ncbi:MAG TPA: hypothetical protein VGV13_04875 [Methylomirabilota bacterium]|nr:hypothetical protein [Methylomirabilota bacterium]
MNGARSLDVMGEGRDCLLIIVSRRESFLCTHLRQIFEENAHVEIVLDRRQGERASPRVVPAVERDRREHDVDASLRALGWAIVTRRTPVPQG